MSSAVAAPRPVTPSGILADELDELSRKLDDLDAVPAGVRDHAHRLRRLAAGLDPYLARCTSPESDALADLARRTARHNWSASAGRAAYGLEQEMLSGHVEGAFLQMLVHATRARRVLEIGTFTGYATLAMAQALPADGRVVSCEVDVEVADLARDGFTDAPGGDRIDLRIGPARDTLATLARDGASFDLVFVDADKAGYVGYLHALLDDRLLAPHGLACFDNTLMQGQPWCGPDTPNAAAIAEFNDVLAGDDRVRQVLVPLRDGVTLVRLA